MHWPCRSARVSPQRPGGPRAHALTWAHFMHHNIWAISLHWPTMHTLLMRSGLPTEAWRPPAHAPAWAHFMHHNIWAISSHWPIKHTIGCHTRLSHGPT